ncbi:hypothetical protein WH87_13555 [Devosia epidermidihirudinis]|uniref:Uncharacterized protein n=1 Tax=Devosia epidermidihirudinis TaxID=1293439 RepID=A0A0F5Q6V9_9HYPH|nr:hypothetical protein WH87_13555 [Devosia epidermidihirudinis]
MLHPIDGVKRAIGNALRSKDFQRSIQDRPLSDVIRSVSAELAALDVPVRNIRVVELAPGHACRYSVSYDLVGRGGRHAQYFYRTRPHYNLTDQATSA